MTDSSFDSTRESSTREQGNVLWVPGLAPHPPPTPEQPHSTSYFDYSPSHLSRLRPTQGQARAHTVPPSPLATDEANTSAKARRRSNLLNPPLTRTDSSSVSSSASGASSFSISTDRREHRALDFSLEQPQSAFSDWGTSVGGGIESRNISNDNLLRDDGRDSEHEEEQFEEETTASTGSIAAGIASVTEETMKEEDPHRQLSSPSAKHAFVAHHDLNPSFSLPHPTEPRPQHHHAHRHHHVSKHLKESTVAESSYPELAIAFFMSLKQFNKSRRLERRASTGSLGGAV